MVEKPTHELIQTFLELDRRRSEVLRELRKRNVIEYLLQGRSEKELAEWFGVTIGFISHVRTGRRKMSMKMLRKL